MLKLFGALLMTEKKNQRIDNMVVTIIVYLSSAAWEKLYIVNVSSERITRNSMAQRTCFCVHRI